MILKQSAVVNNWGQRDICIRHVALMVCVWWLGVETKRDEARDGYIW